MSTVIPAASGDWSTPQWLFDRLHEEFDFNVDVAAQPWNAKVGFYFTPAHDGLHRPWLGSAWCNPPYARSEIAAWVETARYNADRFDTTVVMLIPAWTSTKYWHEHIMKASEIRFIQGRLRFTANPDVPAPVSGGRRRRILEPPWGIVAAIFRGRNRPAVPMIGAIAP